MNNKYSEEICLLSLLCCESLQKNIVVTAIQGLIDAADEQLYKRDNSQDENKVSTEINPKYQILSSFVALVLIFD